jgi:hypothetical protein
VCLHTVVGVTSDNERFVDGDQMTGVFIKEMGAVPTFMNVHPTSTMFDNSRPGIGSHISLSDQSIMAMQSWLMHNTKEAPCT